MKLEDRIAARIRENLAWAVELSAETQNVAQASSPWESIQSLWPLPDEPFVRGLYPVLFGRPADAAGLNSHLASLGGGVPRSNLVRSMALSPEAVARRVDTSWLAQLDAYSPDGIWAVVRRLLRQSDEEFVRGLYKVLLGRDADPDGLTSHVASLTGGQSRVEMVRVFAKCEEAQVRRLDTSWLSRLETLTLDALAADAARHTTGIGPARLARLMKLPDLRDFIVTSFRQVLGRDPRADELKTQLRRLRFIPFYTRRMFLRRLLRSHERSQFDRQQNWQHLYDWFISAEDSQRELADRIERVNRTNEAQLQQIGQLTKLLEQQGRVQERLLASIRQVNQGHRDLAGQQDQFAAAQEQRWQVLQRQNFETGRHLDQLQGLTAALHHRVMPGTPKEPATPQTIPPAATAEPGACRICGGPLVFRWNGKVLHGRFEPAYYECGQCRALQVPQPVWLGEVYREEGQPLDWNPDRGRWVRNFSVYCYLVALHQAGIWSSSPRLLDYGGGYGLLTQLLHDAGYDAWQTDPYVPKPFLAGHRHVPDPATLADQSFDGIVSFEVFEHLTNPAEVGRLFRRLLRPEGTLVISTGIYESGKHGPDWFYLDALEQHVTFWSRPALQHFAHTWGFQSVGYFPSQTGYVMVLSPLESGLLEDRLEAARDVLTKSGFFEKATRDWELVNKGYLALSPRVLVEQAGAVGEAKP